MSTSTDGILAYGVELPDEFEDDDTWAAYGFVDKYGEETPEGEGWSDLEDFVHDVCEKAGIPGIRLVRHCTLECPMYILATREYTAWRGRPVVVRSLDVPAAETLRIGAALKALGIEVEDPDPSWLLASLWA